MARALILLLGLLAVSGCGQPEPQTYRQQLFAFGTLIDITLYDVDATQAREAIQAIDAMYQRQHRDWHAWQKGQLTALNQAIADGQSMAIDPALITLLRMGQRFERDSGGLFNPAIGKLLQLWGFQRDEVQGPPPPAQAIEKLLAAAPSSLQLHIEGTTVSSDNPAVQLDFGGFAKGYSVGMAVALLEQRGIENLIVNAGGDLCLRGRHGDRPWRIGIRNPGDDPAGRGVLASIELDKPVCVFTSGDYERFYVHAGKRYHHILDPRSGYPARGSTSVTVLAADPALADAAATALFVAGPDGWQAVAERMGIHDVLLMDEHGVAHVTPWLAERLHFEQQPTAIEIVQLNR
ncbi:MAG TPA: FAD:protein FMN transferase [Gammaproteobacteria bacterium]|nr:FAD:protein FMN transferase [Gammaproteobacteria bacterium]